MSGLLLFHAPDSGGSNPVKAAVPTYIKIEDTLFPDQSINHQFQSGEQVFVRIPVTDEETAFSVYILALTYYPNIG